MQYREVPKYSIRRRDTVASAAMFALSRSRSDPRINLIMADGRYISPSSSTNSFSHLDNISSPSRDYSDDSPRSMSISSTSSGPGEENKILIDKRGIEWFISALLLFVDWYSFVRLMLNFVLKSENGKKIYLCIWTCHSASTFYLYIYILKW